jgi:siroheme synthase
MKPTKKVLQQRAPNPATDPEVLLAVAIAVPQAVGIPLTAQGLADRVTVLTGPGGVSLRAPNFDPLETLIAVMPLDSLELLARQLLRDRGYPTNWPVAVVEEALHWTPRAVRAPLHSVAAVAREVGIRSRVTVVVGPVVRRADSTVFTVDFEADREVRVA